MIIKLKKKIKKNWLWHKWFAWCPICLQDRNYYYYIVWLKVILRRKTEIGWIYTLLEED